MSIDKVKGILNFTGVAVGQTSTLAHGLTLNGVALVPDEVKFSKEGQYVVVSATTTDLTIRNRGDAEGSTLALCEAWVPVERMLGQAPTGNMGKHLTPQPFSTDATGVLPPVPDTPVTVTIYARTTGSDTTGVGTLANPYRTFGRAIRDIPHIVPAGYIYVVNINGLDDPIEAGLKFPSVHATAQFMGVTPPAPFLLTGVVNVRADPVPFAGIPLADTTILAADIASISADADTGLAIVEISTPRASWAADALKGALLRGEDGNPQASCAIYGSDSTHLFLCNTTAAVATQDLAIVQPGARLTAPSADADGGGFEAIDITSIVFQGIEFDIAGGGTDSQAAFVIGKAQQPFTEMCVLNGLYGFGVAQQLGVFSSVVKGFCSMQGAAFTPRRTLFDTVGFQFVGGGIQVIRQCVFDTCGELGPSTFATTAGCFNQSGWEMLNVLMTGSTGANGAVYFPGAGNLSMESVQINNATAQGIHLTGRAMATLTNVTGTGNNVGIQLEDGALVRVTDNATLIDGSGSTMLVGTLPDRTWTDFRTNAPTKNQVDLASPFTTNVASGLITPQGDDTTGANTGGSSLSRLFQRPFGGT